MSSPLSSLPACHMHVQPQLSLHHPEGSVEAQVVAAVAAWLPLLCTALGLFPALYLWKHTRFAWLPVQMLDKETDLQ